MWKNSFTVFSYLLCTFSVDGSGVGFPFSHHRFLADQVSSQIELISSIANYNSVIDIIGNIQCKQSTIIENIDGLVINGNDHFIDGNASSQIFQISNSNVTIFNLIIQNGNSTIRGGGIFIQNNSVVRIENCTFRNHFAMFGGAMFVLDSTVDIDGSLFLNNFGGSSGGGIFIDSSIAIITESSFSSNLALMDGGAFYSSEAIVTISLADFSSNIARNNSGGGLFAESSTVSLSECSFVSNEALFYGGGAYLEDSTLLLDTTDFVYNSAQYGGGLSLDTVASSLDGCTFGENAASGDGGGVYIMLGSLAIDNTEVYSNTGRSGGAGAVFGAYVTISNSNMQQNTAIVDGGALYLTGGYTLLFNSDFTENLASFGAGVNALANMVDIFYCSFTTHIASNYGGGFFSYYAIASLSDSTFTDNEAIVGGAIFTGFGSLDCDGCILDSNHATAHGGAFYIHYSATGIQNSNFDGNSAAVYGGSFYSDSTTVDISDTAFQASTAAARGGAFYAVETVMLLTSVQIFRCLALGPAGGAFISTDSIVTFSSCEFLHNVGAGGSVLYLEYASLIMRDSTIAHNKAAQNTDGAVYLYYASSNISNTLFHNNTGRNGAALEFYTSSTNFNYIKASNFTRNSAIQSGGAVHVTTGGVTFDQCVFYKNKAKKGGGFYYAGSGFEVNLLDSNFTSNVASFAGGGMYLQIGTVTSHNVLFLANQALSSKFEMIPYNQTEIEQSNEDVIYNECSAYGGCMYSSNYPNNYNNNEQCLFQTTGSGTLVANFFVTESLKDAITINGHEYCGSSSPDGVSVSNKNEISWHSDNSTTNKGFEVCFENGANGGGVYVAGGTNVMNHVVFKNNFAVQYGGGIYVSGGSSTLNIVEMNNNNAELGGAEYYFNGGTFVSYGVSLTNDVSQDLVAGSAVGSSQCLSTCPAGQHGNCETISSACSVNCECVNCTVGTYYSNQFSTDIDDCVSCGSGYFSQQEGAAACSACPIGKFSTDSETDTGGGLDKQTISGGVTCNDCPAGYYSNTEATFVCNSCAAGTSSKQGASNCTDCPVGSKSASGDASCSLCDAGKYGFLPGTQLCIPCDTSKTSSPGSDDCDQADPFYYLLNDEVQDCPSGTVCLGGYNTPIPLEGYWMDISTSDYTDYAYRCPRNTCRGGLQNTSCFTVKSMDNPETRDAFCEDDYKLLCRKGSIGPLCGSCETYYRYSTDSLKCVSCSKDTFIGYIVVLSLCFMVGILLVLKFFGKIDIPLIIWNSWIALILRHLFNSGSLKVLISAYQIIQSVTLSMEVVYPKVFALTLQWFSFLAFETPGLECNGVGIYDRVYFASIAPIALAFIILLIGQGRILQTRRLKLCELDHKHQMDRIKSQHGWMLLFLSYLVVPPIAGKQLKALDCFPFAKTDGARLLRMDTSINCDSDSHQIFEIVISLFLCAYLSIPFLWLVLLYQRRSSLWPTGLTDEATIRLRRKVESDLIVLRFLYERYKSPMACFESFDICRRILFVGVIPLMASSPLMRSAIGLGFALLSMIIYRELTPFISSGTNTVAYIADIVIFLTYASALVIETGLNSGMNDLMFGLILIVVNFSIITTAITAAFFRTMFDKELTSLRKDKSVKIVEYACDYSVHTFATKIDVINRTLVIPSHVSMFYYASLQEIKHILRHGIPVSGQYSKGTGIIFTMHQPHLLDNDDRSVFSSMEAFLVVSLPRRLLHQFTSFENANRKEDFIVSFDTGSTNSDSFELNQFHQHKTALWLLPTGALQALRGAYFDELADPTLWQRDILLLPPQVIKRAFQIDKDAFSEDIEFRFTHLGQLCDKATYFQQPPSVFPVEGNEELMKQQALVSYQRVEFPVHLEKPVKIETIKTYLDLMAKVRTHCKSLGLIPVYHYTRPELSSIIIKSGFRMASEGQSDGGVYFSTYGPVSYDIGSPHYEDNIIIDCFGRARLEELRGRHHIDVCMVYAIDPLIVDKLPDTLHHNAMVIPQEYFQDFSLSSADGNYFLRNDRLLACFHIDTISSASFDDSTFHHITSLDEHKSEIEMERMRDIEITEIMQFHDMKKQQNEKILGAMLNDVAPHVHIEWAVTYGAAKFKEILSSLEKSFQNKKYKLFYHFGTLAEIEKYVRCGIPVLKKSNYYKKNDLLKSTSTIHPSQTKNLSDYNFDDAEGTNETNDENSGILFTSHHPDDLSDEEIKRFGNCEAFLACFLPIKLLLKLEIEDENNENVSSELNIRYKNNGLPYCTTSQLGQSTVHQVRSLRKGLGKMNLQENMSGKVLKSDLFYLPSSFLSAMRGNHFEKVLDPEPWHEGILLLQPQVIKGAFQIISEENIANYLPCILDSTNCETDKPRVTKPTIQKKSKASSASSSLSSIRKSTSLHLSTVVPFAEDDDDDDEDGEDYDEEKGMKLDKMKNDEEAIASMVYQQQLVSRSGTPTHFLIQNIQKFCSIQHIRDQISIMSQQCLSKGLTPYYHYTNSENAKFILKKGFKKSVGSQSGIYFTINSPLNYDLKKINFEDDIILDFYGKTVFKEYKAKRSADVCLVYGLDSRLVESLNKKAYQKRRLSIEREEEEEEENVNSLKLLPRELFDDFSLAHSDDCYYLRPDRVFGALFLCSQSKQSKWSNCDQNHQKTMAVTTQPLTLLMNNQDEEGFSFEMTCTEL